MKLIALLTHTQGYNILNGVHNMTRTSSSRRERLKNELRGEILAAARNLFVRNGYASVSMRKIADTVGCAPGTIYLHFTDKDAILQAICEFMYEGDLD